MTCLVALPILSIGPLPKKMPHIYFHLHLMISWLSNHVILGEQFDLKCALAFTSIKESLNRFQVLVIFSLVQQTLGSLQSRRFGNFRKLVIRLNGAFKAIN